MCKKYKMYVQGHIQIIDEVLEEFFNNEYFDGILEENISYKCLRDGLGILDLPCGKYEIVDDHIEIKKRKMCKITKLFNLVREVEYGENQLFQYHKGFFAHIHSMTTDPQNTVLKIRNKIFMSILGYALNSVYDNTLFTTKEFKPNITWIGMILHCITDSYSPSHTIREKKTKVHIPKKTILNTEARRTFKFRMKLHNDIKTMAEEKRLYKSQHEFKDELCIKDADCHEYLTNMRCKRIFKIYKVFRLEFDTQKQVKKVVKSINTMRGAIGKEQYGDIKNFQSYISQPIGMHGYNDFLFKIRNKRKLYARMKRECVMLLELYKNVLKTRDVKKFLEDVLNMLHNHTYRIHEKYLDDKTNKIGSFI